MTMIFIEYLCHKCPRICSTCRKYFSLFSLLMRYTRFVRLKQRMPLLEQKLLTLPEHLRSSPVFSGVRVTRSFALCVCLVDRCLSFYNFFFWSLCCVLLRYTIYMLIIFKFFKFFLVVKEIKKCNRMLNSFWFSDLDTM